MITANTQNVNVKRLDLLQKLKKNRIKHVEEFNQAVGGYNQAVIDVLQKNLKLAKAGKLNGQLNISLPYPVSQESSYSDVIEMLEMSVDDIINLDRNSFKQYVMDEWSWSSQFKTISSMYNGAK